MTRIHHSNDTQSSSTSRSKETSMNDDTEFITIPEWCRRVACSLDSGYRAARRNEIPGLFRIGRLKRVNWAAFVKATSTESESALASSATRE